MTEPLLAPLSSDNLTAGAPIPPNLGAVVDLYRDVRELRLAMKKEMDAVEAREKELKLHLIDNLSMKEQAEGSRGAIGLRFQAKVVTKETPRAKEGEDGWPVLWKFIQESNRFDLLHKRLSEETIKELWASGYAVPGVEKFISKDVSVTKI